MGQREVCATAADRCLPTGANPFAPIRLTDFRRFFQRCPQPPTACKSRKTAQIRQIRL